MFLDLDLEVKVDSILERFQFMFSLFKRKWFVEKFVGYGWRNVVVS